MGKTRFTDNFQSSRFPRLKIVENCRELTLNFKKMKSTLIFVALSSLFFALYDAGESSDNNLELQHEIYNPNPFYYEENENGEEGSGNDDDDEIYTEKRLRFYTPEKRLRFYSPEKRLRFMHPRTQFTNKRL